MSILRLHNIHYFFVSIFVTKLNCWQDYATVPYRHNMNALQRFSRSLHGVEIRYWLGLSLFTSYLQLSSCQSLALRVTRILIWEPSWENGKVLLRKVIKAYHPCYWHILRLKPHKSFHYKVIKWSLRYTFGICWNIYLRCVGINTCLVYERNFIAHFWHQYG